MLNCLNSPNLIARDTACAEIVSTFGETGLFVIGVAVAALAASYLARYI